jgi:hypothetical protein
MPPGSTLKGVKEEFDHFMGLFLPNLAGIRKVIIAIDVLWAYLVHGAWIDNYFLYGFWTKNHRARKKYVTWKRAVKLLNKANGSRPHRVIREKSKFNMMFAGYINRDWLFMESATEAEFYSFCAKHKTFMEKPNGKWGGEGVAKVEITEDTDLKSLYSKYANKPIILDEYIAACNEISALHPDSLNTVRVATMLDATGGVVSIPAAVLRIGVGGAPVDNLSAGGIAAAIDVDAGVVSYAAVNLKGNRYEFHPDSGKKIVGLRIPAWQAVLDMCKEAALVYKDARFIGWDVAICFDEALQDYKVIIIEANDRQDFPLLQLSSPLDLNH